MNENTEKIAKKDSLLEKINKIYHYIYIISGCLAFFAIIFLFSSIQGSEWGFILYIGLIVFVLVIFGILSFIKLILYLILLHKKNRKKLTTSDMLLFLLVVIFVIFLFF